MKKILFLFITIPFLALGQSQDQNYVKTTVYKTPNTAPIANPNIATASIKVDYFDGLGKPIQQVLHRQSGSGKDMIVHIDYDDFGRQEKEYLPYVNQSPSLSFDSNAETNQLNYYLNSNTGMEATNNSFSQKEFEASPLNRVMKQAAPGEDWRMGGGHEVKYNYHLNSVSDSVVKFKVERLYSNGLYENTLKHQGVFVENSLYKTITKDENWVNGVNNTVEEYKNDLGKIVLKRTYNNQVKHETYYIYDDVGNLCYVIPPLFNTIDCQVVTAIPYNVPNSTATISTGQAPFSGGGSITINISNNVLTANFSGGFSGIFIENHSFNINNPSIYNVEIGNVGTAGVSEYKAYIENGYLKFSRVSGNQPITGFSASYTINLSTLSYPVASVNPDFIDGLCYQYKYDHKNRLVEKKLPGKQWEFIVYDKLDRVVMTGPALSPFTSLTDNGWMITKYDAFSRPILTAWLPATVTSATRKTNQDSHTSATILNESKTTSDTTVNGVGFWYTTTALPTSGYHVLTVNYYDNYDTGLTFTPAISYSDIHGQALLNNSTNKPVGLPTVSWVRVPETATLYKHEKSYTLYDKKGRVVRTFKNNYLTGYLQTDQKLQPITGRVDFTETRHKRLSGEAEIYTKDVFTYTDQDRLLSHTHQIGTSGTPQLLAKNEYDELGQLISKQVGGNDVTTFVGLQKVDYRYNIRGWLKSINDVDNLGTDLFAFKLNYNEVENATNYTGKALYNGNISETYWRTSSDNVKRKYGYFYDNLNRLKNAVYQKPNLAVPVTNSYNESLTYDKNGNITSLFRNGEYDDAGYALEIDRLGYNYDSTKPNQLIRVKDESNNPNGFKDVLNEIDYTYDEFGNMKSDANKGITRISYNHLNLPIEITFAETKHIRYLYNATGQKISKTVTDGSVVTVTEYLDGYQYIKPNNQPYKLHFFPHAEGYVNTIGGNNYVFNYTDHLGNIRLSYGINRSTGVLTVLEENNYYPFGLKHDNYNITKQEYDKYGEDVGLVPCVNCAYKYKYNGKEYQDELGLNVYDYGNRNYDATIGRFFNMDRFSEKYVDTSPYHYTKNNPVFFIDIKGDSLAVFRPDGSFWKVMDDGKKEWSGRYYQDSKVKSRKGKTVTYEYSNAINFEFSDPENDSKAIKDGIITHLMIVTDEKIGNMLGEAGALDPKNKDSWSYLHKEGRAEGKLDFSLTSIPNNFGGASASEFGKYTPYLFLPYGDNLAHNHFNFGNFLFGAAGSAMGFSSSTLSVGAHANSVMNPNGYSSPQLDSKDDQRSIKAGTEYSLKHQFSNRTWSPSTGVSPLPKK